MGVRSRQVDDFENVLRQARLQERRDRAANELLHGVGLQGLQLEGLLPDPWVHRKRHLHLRRHGALSARCGMSLMRRCRRKKKKKKKNPRSTACLRCGVSWMPERSRKK